MAKYYWSIGLLTLSWDVNICESVLNCPTDVLKHARNQPWYSFSLQWGGQKNSLSLLPTMGCTLQSILWKVFHDLFSCVSIANLWYSWCEELWWKTFLHLNLSYFDVIRLLCNLCINEEEEDDEEEVTDDYLHLVKTQMWLFDNVCCCSCLSLFVELVCI